MKVFICVREAAGKLDIELENIQNQFSQEGPRTQQGLLFVFIAITMGVPVLLLNLVPPL
jgi:hypothetical protein